MDVRNGVYNLNASSVKDSLSAGLIQLLSRMVAAEGGRYKGTVVVAACVGAGRRLTVVGGFVENWMCIKLVCILNLATADVDFDRLATVVVPTMSRSGLPSTSQHHYRHLDPIRVVMKLQIFLAIISSVYM
ncbi:hypothetical protein Acr_00g0037840 [Actinidia rufa]|uniref:Uncharacterized protein n=1 Tax=Actinidia rufa TaxID=165716 RepID=A0A7J0DGZ8_9ERIC|nr:hypothetical protein Acr_00g0037840 [Actinidia rufa]